MGPLWKEMPVSRTFSIFPSGSPVRETSLQMTLQRAPTERDTPPPDDPSKSSHRKRHSSSRLPLKDLPQKETLLLQMTLQRAPTERDTTPPTALTNISQNSR
jgi:hypothetical protein